MSVDTIDVLQNTAQNTARGPTPALWGTPATGGVKWLDALENPGRGMCFWEDFIGTSNIPTAAGGAIAQGFNDNFSVYAYQGATITDGAAEGGVITFGSDGDNEGVAFGPTAGAFRLVTTSTLALNPRLVFEARFAPSTITATKGDFFVGLFDGFLSSGLPTAAVPITTTDNTLATKNLIGFHIKGNAPTEINFCFCLSGGTVNYPTNMTTLVASTGATALTAGGFVKVGFVFDPMALTKTITSATARQTAGQTKRALIRVFVNGLECPTFLTSDDVQNATSGQAFPTGFMGPGFAVMNQTGSSPPTMSTDWVRCYQDAAT